MSASQSDVSCDEATLWLRRKTAEVPAYQHLLFSTIAPQLAVLLTNPFDTAKV